MSICKNCGVELEDTMQKCPLCGFPVNDDGGDTVLIEGPETVHYGKRFNRTQKKFAWEIVTIILLSGMLTTLGINLIINQQMTWSTYPVAVSLVIFSYISLFAFWHRGTYLQLAGSFILACFFLVGLDLITGYNGWSLGLAIPLTLAATFISAVFILVINSARYKGINLIGYGFLCVSALCVCIEGILSQYQTNTIELKWSIITGGCILPVVVVLLFVHFRLKKGRSLEKTFHI